MTGDQFIADAKEVASYRKANNFPKGKLTDAQNQATLQDLISKGLVPPGTTMDQMNTAFGNIKFTPAQQSQILEIMKQ